MSARLVIMGPQGSGKGTQAARLASHLGVPTISTGDIFRANISTGTPLGRLAEEYTSRGELVPDEVTTDMVRDRLAQPDAGGGFILDGYPRNLTQLEALDGILADLGVELDAVLQLTAEREELLARMKRRAELEGRADDTAEVIARRLDIYTERTAPVAAAYADRGLLITVDGTGEIDEITRRLLAGLRSRV